MLYEYDEKEKNLKKLSYYNFADFGGKEKDLENLLSERLNDLYTEDAQLMPIFQERQWQEEPDLCALDKDGNLIIFELKRNIVQGDTTIQIMRYAQSYGQMNYNELNGIFQKYTNTTTDLKIAHSEAFGLGESPLNEEQFNKKQKLIIVGSSSDVSLMEAVDYWRSKHIDIDFIPYRFYKIGSKIYFDFFVSCRHSLKE